MAVYTTEITSENIPSDNPIHQRLYKAYEAAKPFIKGDVLELGCGEGRGIDLIIKKAKTYTAIDKIRPVVDTLVAKYPNQKFVTGHFPPVPFEANRFDTILTFQVIEHVKDDDLFVKEIYRLLKPGGKALITTPNIKMTLTRNPWHIREYTAAELSSLCSKYFEKVDMKGIGGNEKVMAYYARNKASVEKITRLDVLNLQHRLPAALLRIPYEILNRFNRNNLKKGSDELVASIHHEDYELRPKSEDNLDLFCILEKK
jgi:SAM-dependent methyltransferase